jgi:hypothetical protein
MKNPNPINLQTDDDLRKLGWTNCARDGDGHLISTCFRYDGDKEDFKTTLLDWFDQGFTVTNLSLPSPPVKAA